MALTEDDIQPQLTIWRPGQSKLSTPINEYVEIQSGAERGVTLGSLIGMILTNEDHRPGDYFETVIYSRPSYPDYNYIRKYGANLPLEEVVSLPERQ